MPTVPATAAGRCLAAAEHSYATCPVAFSADLLAPPFFWRVPLAEAEERFGRHEYGVYCAGNAWHLVQVLSAQGIEAYTFNFGAGSRSHVIVLARPARDLVALDPYLGYYLADDTGNPLPIHVHLEALRSPRDGVGPLGTWVRLPATGAKTLLLMGANTVEAATKAWLEHGPLTVESLD